MGAISYQIREEPIEDEMLSKQEERDIERAAKARPIDSLPSAANAALDALNAAREFILLRDSSPLSELVVKEIESARTLLVKAGAKFLR